MDEEDFKINIVQMSKKDPLCETGGTQLGFGRYGTRSCGAGRISYRAIGAARRATSGQFRRNGQIRVRVFADPPITGKPTEVRMGKGKGNPTGWIARASTGQIPFEMDGACKVGVLSISIKMRKVFATSVKTFFLPY